MSDKRYTDRQAMRLLTRLTAVPDLPIGRARRLFVELLSARLGDVVVRDVEETVASVGDGAVERFQAAVAGYLRLVAELGGTSSRWVGDTRQVNVEPLTLRGVTLTMTHPDDLRLEVGGPFNQMLTVQLYGLVRRLGDRLRVCACGRLYVRVRRQAYCSERCQKRVYMRRFRAGATGEE